ncbi:hypothetical protein L226DRAFT_498293 [Lentinus tigrinus ALCF2SS1-7]|uniref:GST C-terminal domain-containing protein n=1 Tax=Lentinus tigrinus ALCF2SS1-6 TaxID=1328759 RepID=A0A5C2SS91_9APHY|nr:hypothetical protein L227DRAFT_568953 [Lentinus tigrinus ALCF2SS1-6]RPD80679.1 hypothetical protein L226DRAFT_498293 [Lentinus tigrinus ALCF2SS1-7]
MAATAQYPVILYHYDASPIARKVKNMLTIKRIPHARVEVPMTLPRPDLADRLGVKYRLIPVLAIGRDVYCDSSLIASVLERRFPPSEAFGTLFPKRSGGGKADTGMIKAFAMSYADRTIGQLGSLTLPYHKFTQEFLDDRSAWFGKKVDPEAIASNLPTVKSWLSSHLALIEEQLADRRTWLMDTETPGLADISIHYVWEWMQQFRPLRYMQDLFDPASIPATTAWITRMSEYIAASNAAQKLVLGTIPGAQAAENITSSVAEDPKVVGFDEVEASRLGVKLQQIVSVTPSDNGKVATIGPLVALNKEEVTIRTEGSDGTVFCHFPRLYYVVKPGVGSKL